MKSVIKKNQIDQKPTAHKYSNEVREQIITSTLSLMPSADMHEGLCEFVNLVSTFFKYMEHHMDKQIKKVEKDVAKDDKPKAKKDLKKLLKMDKKFDKKLDQCKDMKKKGK